MDEARIQLSEDPIEFQAGIEPAADVSDPLIDAYKRDVDRTLLRENLRLTEGERTVKFLRNMAMIYELRRAGRRMREARESH